MTTLTKNLILSVTTLFFISCGSVRNMQIRVSKPIRVELPNDVKRLAIVDKTQGNAVTIIEGILTGEMPAIDRSLSQECISGITQPFLQYSGIQITRHSERLRSDRGASRGFGNMMPWEQAEQIATENQADALLVLEYFDSDFSIRNINPPNNVGNITYRGHVNVKTGVRIYLPKTRSLFFEQNFTYSNPYGESAVNKAQLLGKLAFGSNALRYGSNQLGNRIGKQFVSYQQWEGRQIFKGKSPEALRAERHIVAGDIDNAITQLERTYRFEANTKLKASMAHNLGYCYEVKGDLSDSKKWLTESFAMSGNKKTRRYLADINRRILETEQLEMQNKSN